MAQALTATITAVQLFGETVALAPPIANYLGEPLFITKIETDAATDTVKITIDDTGPPAASLTLPATPAKARAIVNYDAASATTAATTGGLTYNGKPLVITAIVTPDAGGTPKWGNAQLVPVVTGWVEPTGGVEFVILFDGGPNGQLWWLVNPADHTPSALTSNLIEKAPGVGLNGPFGLGTP